MSISKNMQHNTNQILIFYIGFIAGLAGLLFGMDTGVISGALPILTKTFNLSPGVEGMVVSILLVGAVCGTFISNPISRTFGRKTAIFISAMLFAVTSVISAFAPSITFLIIVRFFLGIALGIASFTTPMYLAEISPKAIRGAMISMYQLMITIGLLLAFVSDTFFAKYGSWQAMLGVVAIPATIMLLLLISLPRSPRWLMLKNREEDARSVLNKILPTREVDIELASIRHTLEHEKSDTSILRNSKFWLVIFLGLAAQMLQQWTGINAVMYYSPTIFKAAGFTSLTAQMWCTVAVGVVNVLSTILAIKYIDRIGRKPILYFGLAVMVISLIITGTIMKVGSDNIYLHLLGVASVLTYIVGFAVSLGPIIWILCAEIFPLRGRDFGVMITTAGNWIFNATLAQIFPTLVLSFGVHGVFWVFALTSLLGIIFVYKFVPETKGVSLEQIEENLMSGKPLCKIGQ